MSGKLRYVSIKFSEETLMATTALVSPPAPSAADLRAALADSAQRPFDLATALGVSEAALVAARCGHGAVRIAANPNRLIPAVEGLGEVMALTRNPSCVIEKVGTYRDFHPGDHAAMTLDAEIDLRIFPSRWVHAFAVEVPGEAGPRRSIQVFDAAGEAVHKVHLRPESNLAAWEALKAELAEADQSDTISVTASDRTDGPRAVPERAEALRREWAKMTDTHQFNTLIRKVKMNRLGAYRVAGAPFARPLATSAVAEVLEQIASDGMGVMIFVGNMGCIEIHSGPIETLKPMGPWLNVLDPRFNLHLRADHIAEIWAVDKPTKRGPAISVEAFDREGMLILQIFGLREERGGDPAGWAARVAALPGADAAA